MLGLTLSGPRCMTTVCALHGRLDGPATGYGFCGRQLPTGGMGQFVERGPNERGRSAFTTALPSRGKRWLRAALDLAIEPLDERLARDEATAADLR